MKKIEMNILVGMHRNVTELDRKTASIAAKHKLTFSQFMVLETLYSKGDMTVGEVRKAILSSVGTIPLIVNNLVKMNYVERLSDEKDRRVCILRLTDEGLKVINEVAPQNEKMVHDYMSVLSEDEKQQLFRLMTKLRKGARTDEKTSKN